MSIKIKEGEIETGKKGGHRIIQGMREKGNAHDSHTINNVTRLHR